MSVVEEEEGEEATQQHPPVVIAVHKFVVSARCHVISRMLSSSFAESSQKEVKMSESSEGQ